MGVLTVAYVGLGVWEDPKQMNLATVAVWVFAGLFLLEFVCRSLDDVSPPAYVRGHWIDLVTCIPAVGPLRLLRLLRLLQVFNTAGFLRRVARESGGSSTTGAMRLLVTAVFVFWLLAGYAFYLTEKNQPGSAVHNFQEALLLAFTTSTSVGYSPIKPVTYEGELVAGLVIFIGLGLLAALSSRLTSFWIEGDSSEQEMKDLLADVRDQLRAADSRLAKLEALMTNRGEAAPNPLPPSVEAPATD